MAIDAETLKTLVEERAQTHNITFNFKDGNWSAPDHILNIYNCSVELYTVQNSQTVLVDLDFIASVEFTSGEILLDE